MNPIRSNKPVFFADDGDVLKSGSVYIGQPNQWPLSFPKTVTLQDSAGSTFTAAQPLRTNNDGRITYGGKAVIALVDGDYSMLIQDRNGVTVADGYTPFIANADAGGGAAAGDVIQAGVLLSDIKGFNVTPGDVVRNVGKTTASDGEGADWLVVSNTGSPGNDEDLIDFANGTQGQRYVSFPGYQEAIVSLGGDFTSPDDQVKITRVGPAITITSVNLFLAHPLNSSPDAAAGAIPSWARPRAGTLVKNVCGYSAGANYLAACSITDTGNLSIVYLSSSLTAVAQEGISGLTITYNI